ncbi:MAG: hypothetical protein EA391_12825 [Balneolaceae bacterium]|nr:MAG: hypothetical protein EA391_12825 [Balneolaceae bacterium]
MSQISNFEGTIITIILVLVIWDTVWKIIALWRSARRNQLGWFIAIALINSAGILPIIYLLMNKDKPDFQA